MMRPVCAVVIMRGANGSAMPAPGFSGTSTTMTCGRRMSLGCNFALLFTHRN